jgi:hypothetical protein
VRVILAALVIALLPAPTATAGPDERPVDREVVAPPGTRVAGSSPSPWMVSTIPSGSFFAGDSGGGSVPCEEPTLAPDGTVLDAGRPEWLYVAGLLAEFPGRFSPTPDWDLDRMRSALDGLPHLASGTVTFTLFCDGPERTAEYRRIVTVPVTDPVLDPRSRVEELRNRTTLRRPIVWRERVVDEWGGLVTRSPAWLALEPASWQPVVSNVETWRMWTLRLVLVPKSLTFTIAYTPAPDGRAVTSPFRLSVPCVTTPTTHSTGAAQVPARPVAFPTFSASTGWRPELGPCAFVPGHRGTLTVTPVVTYETTFVANEYREPLPDFVWEGAPTAFRVGELHAVNTRGRP